MSDERFKKLAHELKTAEQSLRGRIEDAQQQILLTQQQESNFIDSLLTLVSHCRATVAQFNESYGQEKFRAVIEEPDQTVYRKSGQKYPARFAIAGTGCFIRLIIIAEIGKRGLRAEMQLETRTETQLPKPLELVGQFTGENLTKWQCRDLLLTNEELAFELVKWLIEQEASIRKSLAQAPRAEMPAAQQNRRWWRSLFGKNK